MVNFRQLCFLLLVLAYSSIGFSKTQIDKKAVDVMEQLRAEFNLPSFSLAILIDSEVVFSEAIGFADIDNLKPANSQTQYSVGSIAKPMTGLALAKLVDLNKVVLDAPVSTYLENPAFTKDFTVKELAAHIAGVPHNTPEREVAEFKNIKDHESPLDALYVFDQHPLNFAPGSQYQYSSNGYILLSAVMEKATNTGYVDFLKTSLWKKFEMNNTELDTSFAGLENEATYYTEYKDNNRYTESTKKRDRSFLFGGGGFISTPSDLVKMSQATFSPGYLSSDTRHLLSEPVKLRNGEINTENYSIGWRVGQLRLKQNEEQLWTVLHHGGVTDKAATSYLFVIPACQAAVAFATNYVPDKFWQMRGRVARLLTELIDTSSCQALQ